MTRETQQRRIAGVKLAKAVNLIEGVPVSNYATHLSACWARGEITGTQMKTMLINAHKNSKSSNKKP